MVHLSTLQGEQERQSVVPDLHPKLQAALERDGLNLTHLAQVVGLDARTVARWGSDDEYGTRAAAFRRLDDVVAGRARVVETELGSLAVEELGEGVPRAQLVVMLSEAQDIRERMDAFVRRLQAAAAGAGEVLPPFENKQGETTDSSLTRYSAEGYRAPMNASTMQAVASIVRARTKRAMVPYVLKVPDDFKRRVERAAAKLGITSADYVRALVEIHTEADD